MSILFCALLSLWLIGSSPAHSAPKQTPEYSVKHYTSENGLPQNSVKDIVRDNEGYIWLSTENGLVRFDGTHFKVFNKSNLKISTNRFGWFQPSMQKSAGKLFCNIYQDEYVVIEKGKVFTDSIYVRKYLSRIPFFKQGYKKLMLPIASPDRNHELLQSVNFVVPVPIGTGQFYLCTPDSIKYYDQWKRKGHGIPGKLNNYWRIFRSGKNLFLLNSDKTVTKYNGDKTEKTVLKISGDILNNRRYLKSPDDIKIFWNNTLDQSFLYIDKCLYWIHLSKSNVNTQLLLSKFDLDSIAIRSIYYDDMNERLFLGSTFKGLYVLSKNSFKAVRIGKEMDNIVYGQAATNDSTILMPTGDLISIRPSGIVSHYLEKSMPKNLYKWAILTDKKSFALARSNNPVTKIYKFGLHGKKVLDTFAIKDEMNSFFQQNERLIWITTLLGGIYKVNPRDEAIQPELFLRGPSRQECIREFNGTLWLGTMAGLYRINIRSKKPEMIPGTARMNIRSLHITLTGDIWFTTYENGFFLFKNNTLTSFPSDKNHFLETSHCILEDSKGYFWITTNQGLFQISKKELYQYAVHPQEKPYYHYYSRDNGFNTNEFNGGCQPCALRLKNGYVSLPSMDGLVLFVPEKIKPELPSGQLMIDEITSGDISQAFTASSLLLPFDPAYIEIKLTVPYFGNANNLNAVYSLAPEGEIPENWKVLDNSMAIQFSSLPSGNHTLHIRKQNGFGKRNDTDLLFSITVQKAWFQTWWFKLLLLVLSIVILYLIVQSQNRRLVKKNRRLEIAVHKRTKSLNKTLQALSFSEDELNRQVKVQTRIIASLTHDFRSPLRSITSISSKIRPMLEQQNFDMIADIGDAITNSSARINILLENTLDYVKTQIWQKEVTLEKINLHHLIEIKIGLLSLVAKSRENQFQNNVQKNIYIFSNAYLLSIILRNVLDNANKNTFAGHIVISSESFDDHIVLTIADTGSGLPDPILQWINFSHEKDNGQELLENVNGVGLIIIAETAKMLGIKLRAERQKQGSKISLSLKRHRAD